MLKFTNSNVYDENKELKKLLLAIIIDNGGKLSVSRSSQMYAGLYFGRGEAILTATTTFEGVTYQLKVEEPEELKNQK